MLTFKCCSPTGTPGYQGPTGTCGPPGVKGRTGPIGLPGTYCLVSCSFFYLLNVTLRVILALVNFIAFMTHLWLELKLLHAFKLYR